MENWQFILKAILLLAGVYFFARITLLKNKKTMKKYLTEARKFLRDLKKKWQKKLGDRKKKRNYLKKESGEKTVKEIRKEKLIKWLKIVGIAGAICFVLGVGAIVSLFVYYGRDLPNPNEVNKRVVDRSTKIFDRTGQNLLYELFDEERRTLVPMEEIPDHLKHATVALEDDNFYNHWGFDVGATIKATCHEFSSQAGMGNLMGLCPVRGGSTITQQFVKNSLLTSERRISRKIQELILAVEVERNFEKDEILRMYLNEIPYGSNAYGIESAAQTFFGVHAKELTLAQSALLASLPQRPSYFSPDGKHTEELLRRWKKTLDNMAKFGHISQDELEAAKKEDILAQVKPLKIDIKAPHFSLYVRDKLIEEFGEEDIKKGGYRVYTTLDWNLQQLAEKSVREGVEEHGEKWEFENAALVSTNPKNGQVLAMVGSRDYFAEDIDGNVNVAIRMRQPGSSFKPYVYAEAFTKGYQSDTQVFDVLTNFTDEESKEYMPKNYDGRYIGSVKLEDALARSLNVPAVKVLYLAGINDSIRLAKSMGITTLNNPERYGLSLVLGGGEVKLLDHVGAFGVFANEGVKYDQRVILKIEDSEGNIIKEYNNPQGSQVLDRNVANKIVKILSDNKLRTPAFGSNSNLNIPDRTVAAKTGTTNEYRDGWLVGASPSLAAGVWAGNNDNRVMKPGAAGVNVAGPIWNAFMKEALVNYPNEKFSDVEEEAQLEALRGRKSKAILFGELQLVEEIEVCETDDDEFCLETSDCPDDEVEDEKFFVAHNILHYIDKEDPLGDRPRNPEKDPQYDNWERALVDWAEKYADGKGRDPVPTEECEEDDF